MIVSFLSTMTDADELVARRIAAAAMAAVCPHCGRSLAGHGGTYASNKNMPTKATESAQDAPGSSERRAI